MKAHPFFGDVDWQELVNPPPYSMFVLLLLLLFVDDDLIKYIYCGRTKVQRKSAGALFVPVIDNETDTSYFELSHLRFVFACLSYLSSFFN